MSSDRLKEYISTLEQVKNLCNDTKVEPSISYIIVIVLIILGFIGLCFLIYSNICTVNDLSAKNTMLRSQIENTQDNMNVLSRKLEERSVLPSNVSKLF